MRTLLLFIFLILLSGASIAQEIKAAYVNTARLYKEAPQLEMAEKKLADEFADRNNEILSEKKELQRMDDDLRKKLDLMSPAQRKKAESELLGRVRDLRRKQEEFNDDLNIRRNDILSTLQEVVRGAVEVVGKEDGYDFIFTEGTAYANPKLDITDKVLSHLKSQTAISK